MLTRDEKPVNLPCLWPVVGTRLSATSCYACVMPWRQRGSKMADVSARSKRTQTLNPAKSFRSGSKKIGRAGSGLTHPTRQTA